MMSRSSWWSKGSRLRLGDSWLYHLHCARQGSKRRHAACNGFGLCRWRSKGRLVTAHVPDTSHVWSSQVSVSVPESAAFPCTSTTKAFGHAAPAEACALFSAQLAHDLLEPRILWQTIFSDHADCVCGIQASQNAWMCSAALLGSTSAYGHKASGTAVSCLNSAGGHSKHE